MVARIALSVCVACAASSALLGGPLAPDRWEMTGPKHADLGRAVDNDIDTAWVCPAPQKPGTGILIDLKRRVHVHRVYLAAGRNESWYPRSVRVLVGESPDSLEVAAEELEREGGDRDSRYWLKIEPHPESSIKFEPKAGRFVRIEIGQNGAGYPWSIGELEIYAASRQVADEKWNVVVIEKDAPPALQLAARELRYYLTELLDVPTRIIPPEAAERYQGLRVRLVTPEPEKLPYPENDPAYVEDVSVVADGNDLTIAGPTPRAVLYGAYELLQRQGVRWLYAGPHGDFVPKLRSLRRSVLPIGYRPPFVTRYANFTVAGLASRTRTEDGFLFFVRHHFNNTWGNSLVGTLGGLPPRMNLGFGYIHNLDRIIPEAATEEHPDWVKGPYRQGWCKVPCTSNPEVIDHVVQRIKQESASQPQLQGFSIHPKDVPAFCECERCLELFGQPEKTQVDMPDESASAYDYSDRYFYLINEVAKRVRKELPGKGIFALAYANHGRPPKGIEQLPDNVMVDVTLHWKHNLPVDSPLNEGFRKELEAWAAKCRHLGIYDYVLIHTDTTFGRPAGEWYTLVPLASPIVDHHRFFHELGVTSVGTQAMGDICWSSPWSVYAYGRSAWNPEESSETILGDFFRGFYLGAAKPMRRWYRALEDHVVRNNVAYSGGVGTYGPVPEAYPHGLVTEMRSLLRDAERRADKWYVRERVGHAAKCLEWSYRLAYGLEEKPVYPCYRVAAPPKIDGRLDDAVWPALPRQTGFRVATTDHFAFTRQTSFRIGWDAENLYFGARCEEPQVEAVKTRTSGEPGYLDISKVSWAQFYHDLIELFLVPEEPIYFQAMVNAIGQYVGPNRHVGHMHNREAIPRKGLECGTHLGDGRWEMELKIPFSALGYTPSDGDRWKANVVRVSSQEQESGEQFTSWPHLERFNFHQRSQYNYVIFQDRVLAAEDARGAELALNGAYLAAKGKRDGFLERLAAFEAKVKGKENLCASARGSGMGRDPNRLIGKGGAWTSYGAMPHVAVVQWKEPVEMDAVRIQWGSRKEFPSWYGLEWFDGETYRTLAEARGNRFEAAIHEFDPIRTDRLRLTIFKITGGSTVTLAKSIEAFRL